MDRPWHSHFDLGVILGMMFPETGDGDGPVLERAKQIFEDEFFTILEITHIKDSNVRAELRAMAEVSDTKLGFRAQVPILNTGQNLAALDEDKRMAGVENVKESLDEALELGCVAFSLMDGRDSYPGEETKFEAIDALERSLLEICAHARACANGGEPIPISLEQFDQVVDKKIDHRQNRRRRRADRAHQGRLSFVRPPGRSGPPAAPVRPARRGVPRIGRDDLPRRRRKLRSQAGQGQLRRHSPQMGFPGRRKRRRRNPRVPARNGEHRLLRPQVAHAAPHRKL